MYQLFIIISTYIILKTGNLKKKNRDHKQVAKQDEDTGNL